MIKRIAIKAMRTGRRISDNALIHSVHFGGHRYKRRPLLPNLVPRRAGHEDHLDLLYRSALAIKQGCVVDVGVNAGQTLTMMLGLAPDRRYLGFEPQAFAAACAQSIIVENKLGEHEVLPIALSDRPGVIPIHVRGTDVRSMANSGSSIIEGFRPESYYSRVTHIYAVRGDDIMESLGVTDISILKIDVEGAELEVVRGLHQTIQTMTPFIVFEVLHNYLVVTKQSLDEKALQFRNERTRELEKLIRSLGYHIYQIRGHEGVAPVDSIEPEREGVLEWTDYIAVPHGLDEEFRQLVGAGRPVG